MTSEGYLTMVVRLRAGPLRTLIRSPGWYIFIFYKRPRGEGHAVAQLVEALRYKPEGCGFDFPWCYCNFSLI